MKYKINFMPAISLLSICILLGFRIAILVTGNNDTTAEELAAAQASIQTYIDYIPTLLTFAMTAALSIKNAKNNLFSCVINAIAALLCLGAIFLPNGTEVWVEYGCYFSLALMLLGFCIVPKPALLSEAKEEHGVDNHRKERTPLSVAIFVTLSVVMIGLAIFSFINGTPKYTISNGIVYLFGLVILLLISDSIETFSIGSIFTLKKKVKEKEAEVTKLESENHDLRMQIVSVVSTVSTSLSNKNSNFNLFDLHGLVSQLVSVEQATADEVKRKEDAEQEAIREDKTHNTQQISRNQRQRFQSEFAELSLQKFLCQSGISNKDIHREIRFSEHFIDADPVIDRNVIFDAYIKRPFDEVFIEITNNLANIQMDYRFYYMISKIYHYSNAINTSAKMLIIVYRLPQSFQEKLFGSTPFSRNPEGNIRRVKTVFAPAIKNGLLEIIEINISEKECAAIENSVMQNEACY